MADFEDTLTALGREIAWPRERDLWPGVRSRILSRRRPARWRSRPVLALAALSLLLAAALVVSPDARALAREILRIGGIQIIPAEPSRPAATASPSLGQPVTLVEASRRLGAAVLVPAALGTPDEIYSRAVPGGDAITLVYRRREGIPVSPAAGASVMVTELRGSVEPSVFTKLAGQGTKVEQLRVNGGTGAWLEGEPHSIIFRRPDGSFDTDGLRMAGNTLLWEQGSLTVRIEAQITREEALRIAATVR